MVKQPEKYASPSEQTRMALLRAGLRLFGRKGYEGTSTRELAALAKANIGSIAYHFGGKEGLHLACADFIVESIRSVSEPALAEAAAAQTADAAAEGLNRSLEQLVSFFVASPEIGDFAQFVLRELSVPSPALDRLYDGIFAPTHKQLCLVWEQATGEPAESEAVKLRMFMMIGQVVYFRIAREAVLRRMDWTDIGPQQAATIAAIASGNLSAILGSRKGKQP